MRTKRKMKLMFFTVITLTMLAWGMTMTAYAESNSKTIDYRVKKGDTFYLLAQRFGTSVEDISLRNPKTDPDNLDVQGKLKIPVGNGVMIHNVKKGDTLWKIARKHAATINAITDRNMIANPDMIYAGDTLAIAERGNGEDISSVQKHVIELIRNRDFKALSKYVHPVKGIRFSPYPPPNIQEDLVFTSAQVSKFTMDKRKYVWGYGAGSGDPMKMTPVEYFNSFVYDKDFARIGIEKKKYEGMDYSTPNPLGDVYSRSMIAVYYYSGSEKYHYFDWSRLILAYEKYNGKWYIIGTIHDQWTI
ncbi:MAG: LysM peptidoglycan-binding domain-containing protein [Clostridia bacterium]|nr:LysM peptidoglycan-binding domain-containing protein [Clostridia bacterium]